VTRAARLLPLVQAAVTISLLAWVFRAPATREHFATVLRAMQPGWFALAIAVAGLCILASIVRWRLVLTSVGLRIPFRRLSSIALIGAFFDLFIFGATGGDAVKALYVAREARDRKIRAILSVVFDHLTGIAALGVAAALFAFPEWRRLSPTPASSAIFGFLALYLAALAAAVVFVLMVAWRPAPRMLRDRPFFKNHGEEVHRTFRDFVSHWRCSGGAVAMSFVIWILHFTVFWCSARAIGSMADARALLAATPAVEACATLPVSIAGLGVRETAFTSLLGAISGVPAGEAAMISLGGFAAMLVWSLVGGVVFIFTRGSRSQSLD
jgi:glycosyltransferase 2 family protein